MAQYYSVNAVRVGGIGQVWPGSLYSDTTDNITLLQNAGVVLKPATDPIIAAAAAVAADVRASGGSVEDCLSIMLTAVMDSLAGSAGVDAAAAAASAAAALVSETNAATSETNAATSEGNAATSETNAAASAATAAAAVPVLASATIALADLSGLGLGVTTFTKNIGGVQPAGQRFAGVVQHTLTGFDDGAAATYTIDVGWAADDNALVSASDVAVATASGFPKGGNGASAFYGLDLSALQLQVKITSSVDLNTTLAGSITIDVLTFLP